jgi:hypothetical protein
VLGWLKLALDVTWSWIALSVIRAVYKPQESYWVIINRVMQALFSASLLLLAEKVFLRYVALNFHRRALADRIAENQTGLRALDRLSNATPNPSARRNPYGQNWKRGHRSGSPSAIVSLGGHSQPGSHQGSSSSSPIGEKDHEKARQHQQQHAKHQQHKRKRRPMTAVIVDNIVKSQNREGETMYSASKLARKLFGQLSSVDHFRQTLVVEGAACPPWSSRMSRSCTLLLDFYPYFKSTTDAVRVVCLFWDILVLILFQQAAFAVFDKDGNGDISKREMREAVRRIYRERRALTASLKVRSRLCMSVLGD